MEEFVRRDNQPAGAAPLKAAAEKEKGFAASDLPSEDALDDDGLGKRLRNERKSRRLSLAALAARSGISLSLISQIERGQVSPSYRSLRMLCAGLSLPMESLFRPSPVSGPTGNGVVVRPADRRILNLKHKGIITEYIDPDAMGAMQMMLITIEPGGDSVDTDRHEGEEGGFVLSGLFELRISGVPHLMREGDSFRFNAEEPHAFGNPGEIPTRVVWFITPTLYGEQGLERL